MERSPRANSRSANPCTKPISRSRKTHRWGWRYGAELDYEGWYNELNRSPYATLAAHIAYRHNGFEYGLYGTNLTNVYADPFTVVGGGFIYGGIPGAPVIPTDAFVLQGAQVNFVLTRSI